jgi:hypothetical protein
MARSQSAILKGRVSDFVEAMAMSLAEVLPEVQSLSRLDKIRLIQFLAQELERDDGGLIEQGRSYPIWSPDQAFAAAAALMQALEEDAGQS